MKGTQNCTTAVTASRLVVVLAMVTGLVVSNEMSDGEPPVSQDPSVSDRLVELERVVARQDQQLTAALALISSQEALVGRMNDKVADQEQKLAEQDQKLSEQEALIELLNQKLEDQDQMEADLAMLWQSHNGYSYDGHPTDQSSLPTLGSGTKRPSGPHDVMARAYEGPLEGVVATLSQQVTEMSADLQALEHSDQQQTHDIRTASSSVFVRWGAADCDNSSKLLYSGVVGGSSWDHSGSGTNSLCLTTSPVMASRTVPSGAAYLYGGEYETGDSHDQLDPVCAVCRSSFSITFMVPGTNVCSPGWRLLYSGYLMANYYNYAAGSDFICVDSSLQGTPGSSDSRDGKLLYFTAAWCGSLPCPPYENNKLVTCAVCAQ